MPKIKVGNQLQVRDKQSVGMITKFEIGKGVRKEKDGADYDEADFDALIMHVRFEGSIEPIILKKQIGLNLNPEPMETLYEKNGKKAKTIYNTFTTLMLALELIDLDTLDHIGDYPNIADDLEKKFPAIVGTFIETELKKEKTGKGYFHNLIVSKIKPHKAEVDNSTGEILV